MKFGNLMYHDKCKKVIFLTHDMQYCPNCGEPIIDYSYIKGAAFGVVIFIVLIVGFIIWSM